MLALLLLLFNAHAGGYDQPGSVQYLDVELLLNDITDTDYSTNKAAFTTALADELTGISSGDITFTNETHPHVHFSFQAGNTFAEMEGLQTEAGALCTTLSANSGFNSAFTGVTLDAGCIVNTMPYSAAAGNDLNGNCSIGDYEVSGVNLGVPVLLNFSRSYFSVGANDGASYLNLDFRVPTMYFYTDQNVTGTGATKNYNRGVSITFHDRWNETERGAWKDEACFSTRDDFEHCPQNSRQWLYEDDEQCSQRLQGKLPFLDLLYQENADPDNIIVLNNTRMINGYLTSSWDLYMVAFVETWAGFIQESPLSGNGDLYFNNPNSTKTDWAGHLEINAERYSYYILPFRVSWPQMITIDAEKPITSAARLIVLYAIITQKQLEINFTPQNGEKFGILHITIQTQTQFPFGLRNDTDPVAPALSKQISGHASGAPMFRDSEHWSSCVGTLPDHYCIQNWHMTIEPTLCDVSGTYSLEFWAECFNNTKCALDINAPELTSNSYSGILEYEITTQEFCPTILDEIYTQGSIQKYVDPEFLIVAQPGVNLFTNDHVYFEVTFLTKSQKSQLTFAEGDDTLIEFVRPYHIEMEVTMTAEPLQTNVNADNGDVTFPTADTKNYVIMLCTANRMNYPYTGNHTDCFTQMGWNAVDFLAFTKRTSTNGTNSIDDNEIAFSLRLDERVMPVDVPNSPISITIRVDVEIFYHGNDNPGGRRSLKVELPRRRLQDGTIQEQRMQTGRVQDMFGIVKRPGLLYCPLKSALSSAGFSLDLLMHPTEIPDNRRSALADITFMRMKIGEVLDINPTTSVEIYQVDNCDDSGCTQVYPRGRRSLSGMRYGRYYIDIKNFQAAVRFQEMVMNPRSVLYKENGLFHHKIVKRMQVDHCVAEAQEIFNAHRTQQPADHVIDGVQVGESSSVPGLRIVVSIFMALFLF